MDDWWEVLGLSKHHKKGVKNSYTHYYLDEWNQLILRDDMQAIYDSAFEKANLYLADYAHGFSQLVTENIANEKGLILLSQIRYYIMARFKILDPDTWYKNRGQVVPDFKVGEQWYQK